MGSVLFVVCFHTTRFLLNIPFLASTIITLCILAVFSLFGLLRITWRLRIPDEGFLWAFMVSVVLLALFPGASWDQSHHIPAVCDLIAGIHPLHAAEGTRPGVTGGFYHYGVEALAAVSIFIAMAGSVKLIFKLVELVTAAASFWLLYRLIRDFFSREAALPGTLVFFWAGNFLVLLNLGRLISGSGWHEVPILIFWGEFAKGQPPFPGFFFHTYHPTLALSFPVFLVALWLVLRGGKTRAALSGLLLGPLSLANVAMSVSLLGVLFLYPILKRLATRVWDMKEWGLSLAGGALSALLLGLPFLLFQKAGPGFETGPFWTVTLELQRNIPLLLGAPVIFLGVPIVLAVPGFILAIRGNEVGRNGLAMFLSLAITGLLIPHIFGTNDFVKLFMVGFLGYAPLAGLVLRWLWVNGWPGRVAVILCVAGMTISPLAFYIFRWLCFGQGASL
ncbi:MAG: hypothetical protein ACP5QG_02865 [candidate division WOR-3 bacterium]